MNKTILAVRGIEALEMVYRNPAKRLQALNSALRVCALDADRAALRIGSKYSGKEQNYQNQSSFTAIAENLFETFLVDRQIKRRHNQEQIRRTFKGYGDGFHKRNFPISSGSSNHPKVSWNMGIICNNKGCHSSVHRQTGKRIFENFTLAYFGDEAEKETSEDHQDIGQMRSLRRL